MDAATNAVDILLLFVTDLNSEFEMGNGQTPHCEAKRVFTHLAHVQLSFV